MRTRGAMGKMVDRMTRGEKQELFSLLDRIETGVRQATGRLDQPQTRVELEDIRIVGQQQAVQNVAAPAFKSDIFELTDVRGSNVVSLHEKRMKKTEIIQEPIKAFPKEFYDYFEFIKEDEKTG